MDQIKSSCALSGMLMYIVLLSVELLLVPCGLGSLQASPEITRHRLNSTLLSLLVSIPHVLPGMTQSVCVCVFVCKCVCVSVLLSSAVECESRVGCKYCPVNPSEGFENKQCMMADACPSMEPGRCGWFHPVMY